MASAVRSEKGDFIYHRDILADWIEVQYKFKRENDGDDEIYHLKKKKG